MKGMIQATKKITETLSKKIEAMTTQGGSIFDKANYATQVALRKSAEQRKQENTTTLELAIEHNDEWIELYQENEFLKIQLTSMDDIINKSDTVSTLLEKFGGY